MCEDEQWAGVLGWGRCGLGGVCGHQLEPGEKGVEFIGEGGGVVPHIPGAALIVCDVL